METYREHLIVDSVEMVQAQSWEGLGAFNVGAPIKLHTSLDIVQQPIIQALVKARYGPQNVGRPADGVSMHLMMDPRRTPRVGDVLRVTVETMPEGGWSDWSVTGNDQSHPFNAPGDRHEMELAQKGVMLTDR